MKCPCKVCLIQPCCNQFCSDEREYRHYLNYNINGGHKFIYSKNGNRRKRIPEVKRLQYNSFIEKWNQHVIIANRIIYRKQMEE